MRQRPRRLLSQADDQPLSDLISIHTGVLGASIRCIGTSLAMAKSIVALIVVAILKVVADVGQLLLAAMGPQMATIRPCDSIAASMSGQIASPENTSMITIILHAR